MWRKPEDTKKLNLDSNRRESSENEDQEGYLEALERVKNSMGRFFRKARNFSRKNFQSPQHSDGKEPPQNDSSSKLG